MVSMQYRSTTNAVPATTLSTNAVAVAMDISRRDIHHCTAGAPMLHCNGLRSAALYCTACDNHSLKDSSFLKPHEAAGCRENAATSAPPPAAQLASHGAACCFDAEHVHLLYIFRKVLQRQELWQGESGRLARFVTGSARWRPPGGANMGGGGGSGTAGVAWIRQNFPKKTV